MQQETHLSSEQLLEAQEDGMGIFVSCGPALWRKLRAEDGPEARDLGQISCLPCLCGKRGYQHPGFMAGGSIPWEVISSTSRFLEFLFPQAF